MKLANKIKSATFLHPTCSKQQIISKSPNVPYQSVTERIKKSQDSSNLFFSCDTCKNKRIKKNQDSSRSS